MCRMRSRLSIAMILFALQSAGFSQAPPRPKITGISHLAVYTSNPAATDRYYREVVGAAKLPDPENPKGVRYAISAAQFVEDSSYLDLVESSKLLLAFRVAAD